MRCATEARISYDQMKQLYFQNPKFGFYLMRLTGQRLFRDVARLESEKAIHSSTAAAS
jgi:CRP/FNR family transcriptional regulator, cyclic AMP receptor protein